MITYTDNVDKVLPEMLEGFFVTWSNVPSKEKHLELLHNSTYKLIAIDIDKNKVVGFITAISDNTLSAYIPFLEVIPEYQHKSIGSELVKQMLNKLRNYYMIDLVCDEHLEKFYNQFGMEKAKGMIKRNYENQKGADQPE